MWNCLICMQGFHIYKINVQRKETASQKCVSNKIDAVP